MSLHCFTINEAKEQFHRFAGLSNNAQLEMVELKVILKPSSFQTNTPLCVEEFSNIKKCKFNFTFKNF